MMIEPVQTLTYAWVIHSPSGGMGACHMDKDRIKVGYPVCIYNGSRWRNVPLGVGLCRNVQVQPPGKVV